jgi:hypothetical protein
LKRNWAHFMPAHNALASAPCFAPSMMMGADAIFIFVIYAAIVLMTFGLLAWLVHHESD